MERRQGRQGQGQGFGDVALVMLSTCPAKLPSSRWLVREVRLPTCLAHSWASAGHVGSPTAPLRGSVLCVFVEALCAGLQLARPPRPQVHVPAGAGELYLPPLPPSTPMSLHLVSTKHFRLERETPHHPDTMVKMTFAKSPAQLNQLPEFETEALGLTFKEERVVSPRRAVVFYRVHFF